MLAVGKTLGGTRYCLVIAPRDPFAADWVVTGGENEMKATRVAHCADARWKMISRSPQGVTVDERAIRRAIK